MMSTVTLDPRQQGSVEDFTITSVGPEQRVPLHFKALIDAAGDRRARSEADFQQPKKDYSDANLKTIEEILKLESNPTVKFTPAAGRR